jgi:uncharacterized protein YlbG (UPF0298 family)
MVRYTIQNILKNFRKRVEKHPEYEVLYVKRNKCEDIVVKHNDEELFSHTIIGSWKNAELSDLKYLRRCSICFSQKLDKTLG